MPEFHQEHYLATRELVVAMTWRLDAGLRAHFDRPGRQEDLTFAYWKPSTGTRRFTAVLTDLVLPDAQERLLDGNVAFTADYLTRVLMKTPKGSGIALLHSHLGPGWQDMSVDDVIAERDRLASAIAGATGLPLVGLTWGTDGTWSARLWGRRAPFTYARHDAKCVRVVGPQHVALSFHPGLAPPPAPVPSQQATASVWGNETQADLARIRVGIVGLGSVGSIVTEALMRTGISDAVLIDHDVLKNRNLDRTLHATRHHAETQMMKVDLAAAAAKDSHTAKIATVTPLPISVATREGIEAVLDCDVIISCVDRPWPRWLLNTVSYSHLVPMIDGGIQARVTSAGRPLHVDWRVHTVGPGRACLVCLDALRRSDAGLDRDGLLDDPDYLKGLSESDRERYNRRNVFAFSLSVAAHEVLQLVGLISGSPRIGGVGPQHYAAYPGEMTVAAAVDCVSDCEFAAMVGSSIEVVAKAPDGSATQP
ncbi:ThiF family adenylyltransferase [Amycolatopsis sp. lyj-23]|uniref:ThiF family adenylyltransferase n=1 Tax=Amycolatopsis sp. lyj-23 TaxID=2789283 RepID=UPI00397859F8